MNPPVIMIVEDQKYCQMVLQKMIGNMGITVITTSDGKEAVKIFSERNDISIILMDLKMPVMDGYTAMQEIRKINPGAVIIAETAYSLPCDMDNILEAGFDDYITKPIVPETLRNIIYKHLRP